MKIWAAPIGKPRRREIWVEPIPEEFPEPEEIPEDEPEPDEVPVEDPDRELIPV